MNIDERLEKLAERHEALALTIELDHRAFGERMDKLAGRQEALGRTVEMLAVDLANLSSEVRQVTSEVRQVTGQVRVVTDFIREMAAGITGLTAIVRSHEQRLSNLENPA